MPKMHNPVGEPNLSGRSEAITTRVAPVEKSSAASAQTDCANVFGSPHQVGHTKPKLKPMLGKLTQRIDLDSAGFLRLPEVLALIRVSRSTYYAGMRTRRYPPSVAISAKCRGWPVAVIRELIASPAAYAASHQINSTKKGSAM